MSRIFGQHGTDWSRVPRPEPLNQQGYGSAQPIRLSNYYTARVYADNHAVTTKPQLSVGVAYVLWLLLGLLGAHYFYMGKIGVGFLYLLTGGLLGIGWLIDLFTLKGQVERANRRQY